MSCGTVVLDGREAAWTNGTYHANEVRLSTDRKEICTMIGADPGSGASRDIAHRFMKRYMKR